MAGADIREPGGQTADLRFDLAWLWLGLLPFAVYGLFIVVFEGIRPAGLLFPLTDQPDSLKVAAAEAFRRRHLWLSAFAVAGALCIAVSVAAATTIRNTPIHGNRLAVVGVAIAAILIMLSIETYLGGVRWYSYLGKELFTAVFEKGEVYGTWTRLDLLDRGLDVIKWLGMIALILVTLCFVLTLAHPVQGASADEQKRLLAAAAKSQRTLLAHLTAIYVVAIVAMFAWMNWPASTARS
jgi:hypothetical protein